MGTGSTPSMPASSGEPATPDFDLPVGTTRKPDRRERSTPDEGGTVFILGAARSGTSLLYKTLCLHPNAAWISNWVARFPRLPQLAALNRVARAMPSRARGVWFGPESNAYVYGTQRPLMHRLFPMPVEGEPVYRTSGIPLRDAADTGIDRTSRLRRAFHSIRMFGGGRVFLSKRIANNLRIPVLAGSFPQSRFVDMTRDGRAVAFSLSRVDWWPDSIVWWYGGTPTQWRIEGRDPWDICARNWVEELRAIREGLRSVPEERVLRVRYEDLVADPSPTLERIAGFAGLGSSARWTASVSGLSFPDRNEAWRKRLEPEVVARIMAVQREELGDLGYPA